jgi:serine/threonine protein kinase
MNVLIDKCGGALLCDFGLSRVKTDINSRTTADSVPIVGSRNWMAPELLLGRLSKPPSDIYAFGMTIFEVRTGLTVEDMAFDMSGIRCIPLRHRWVALITPTFLTS